jgi:hypothetical protein
MDITLRPKLSDVGEVVLSYMERVLLVRGRLFQQCQARQDGRKVAHERAHVEGVTFSHTSRRYFADILQILLTDL